MQSSRRPSAADIKERTEQVREELERQRLAQLKLSKQQIAEDRKIRKQEALLTANLIQLAGNGNFFVSLPILNDQLRFRLEKLGFSVLSLNESIKIVKRGLIYSWSSEVKTSTILRNVIQPIEKYVKYFLEKLGKKFSAKEHDQILAELFSAYYTDIDQNKILALGRKLNALHLSFIDKNTSVTKIILDDYLRLDFERTELGARLMQYSLPNEFLDICEMADEIWYDFYDSSEDSSNEVRDLSLSLSEALYERLLDCKASYVVIAWFDSLYFHNFPPASLSSSLFWLASEDGQRVLNDIYKNIESESLKGNNKLTYKFSSKHHHKELAEVLCRFLIGKGFKLNLIADLDKRLCFNISWGSD
ncbi:MAG: hypothetical protein EBU08_04560 [Micrococcales bacterium]|nr:hypothetical protein [Micrococcales bacterium]